MLGEFLYGLTPRDAGNPLLRPFYAEGNLLTTAASTNLFFRFPVAEAVFVTGISANWTSTAPGLETVPFWQVAIALDQGTFVLPLRTERANSGQNNGFTMNELNLMIDPRVAHLRWIQTWSGAADLKQVSVSAWGMLLPLGNLAVPNLVTGTVA